MRIDRKRDIDLMEVQRCRGKLSWMVGLIEYLVRSWRGRQGSGTDEIGGVAAGLGNRSKMAAYRGEGEEAN